MKVAYYKGCLASLSAKELDTSTQALAPKVGLELIELEAVTCCGAGDIHEAEPDYYLHLNARILAYAEATGAETLMTICNVCTLNLRQANWQLKNDEELRGRVNENLQRVGVPPYSGEVEVKHFLWLIAEGDGYEQLKQVAHRGLKGLKIAPFYGCQILRPSKILGFEDPDRPWSLERIIEACGGEAIDYPAKIKCCGFPIIQAREETALGELIQPIEQAMEAGADVIVTPCPLCHLSLDAWQSKLKAQTGRDYGMPILHLSQLVGVAAGLEESELKFKRHVVSVKPVIEKLAEGGVDILIATHRLLGKDIAFRDLGLLIVDEEQRFGVAQKERLKEWKASIDVLAMSATPIPRSLHLSLSGLRDLSIIETPPRDRLAIETQVVPRKSEVIREAIEAELARGGQVFFVHNRVESIGRVKQELEELIPSVRVTVAHGAMREGELEKAMTRFLSRESDLLLATTIIENGLDIPSANTILIDRAETYGLAQLYQLRGRVGRSDKPAQAFLLVEETAALSETARRRLASIQEFCDLGAGFRIAAKDLEIRGSGNILGGEQSGQIASVGFETYLTLLEEAVREMRGEEPLPERAVTLSLGLDLTIPPAYVADENWRMMIYKKIARASDDRALEETAREIADRFGDPPDPVKRLVAYSRLRVRAERLRVTSITRQSGQVHLRFAEDAPVDPERLLDFVRRTRGAKLSPGRILSMPSPAGDLVLDALQSLLEDMERKAA